MNVHLFRVRSQNTRASSPQKEVHTLTHTHKKNCTNSQIDKPDFFLITGDGEAFVLVNAVCRILE